MKRIISMILATVLLFSLVCAAAEDEASESDLGKEIFDSLTREYDYSLNYLKHRYSVWLAFTENKGYDFTNEYQARAFWENYVFTSSDGSFTAIAVFYIVNEIGYPDTLADHAYEKMFMPLFEHFGKNENGYRKACDALLQMVFYGDSDCHYSNLETIKEKIKELSQKYPDYEYNSMLREFYKKCLQLTDYITGSSDNYLQMKEEISDLERTKRELRSEFDFDFEWKEIGMDSCYEITDTVAKFYQRARRIDQSRGFKALDGIFQSGLAPVRGENGLWGYVDTAGNLVIDCVYNQANPFRHGYAIVKDKTGKAGAIDTAGNEIIPIGKYEHLGSFEEELFRIRLDNKLGYANEKGEIVIEPVYEGATYFSEGYASVKIDGKWGAINKAGEIVIPPQFENLFIFSEGKAAIEEGDVYYYIDILGNKLFGSTYAWAYQFSEGLAICRDTSEKDDDNNYLFRVIGSDGETVYTVKCRNLGMYQEGMVWYLSGEKLGFLDDKGQQVIPPVYDSFRMAGNGFTDGYVAVEKGGKWGVIDKHNNVKIPFEYDDAYPYNEGYCIARKGNQIYIFDRYGNNIYDQ